LKKKPDYEPDYEKLFRLQHEFNFAAAGAFEGGEKEGYQKFLNEEERMLNGEDADIPELIEQSRYYTEIIKNMDFVKILSNFWVNNAERYGLEYSSNYNY